MKTSILKKSLNATLLFFSLFYCLNINSQTVTTIAGDGTNDFADGIGTAAKFKGPTGIAVDNNGNIFVADRLNHRIRKITTAGVVTTFAGSGVEGFLDGTGTTAQFAEPFDIAIDFNGNIYVADCLNHRIRKISSMGVVTTLAGDGTHGFADGVGSSALFKYPEGIAVDNIGNIYVADAGNQRIRKITPTGDVTTLAGDGNFGFADGPGATAMFGTPCSVAVDADGNIFVAEKQNNRIRKISTTGMVTTVAGNGNAGKTDGTGTEAQFRTPFGVTIDATGNIYVADSGNHRIRKITPAGVVTTIAGSTLGYMDGVGTAAKFKYPIGIFIATDGSIYLSESSGSRIRKITFTLDIDSYQMDYQLSVYPNPVSSLINLELNGLILSEITIFDLNGKSVEFKNNFNNENTMYIGSLQNGFYTMKITTDKGIFYKKILKN